MDVDGNLQVWDYLNERNSTKFVLEIVGAWSLWSREMKQGEAARRKGGEGEEEEGARRTQLPGC